jgi:hypothetical protein
MWQIPYQTEKKFDKGVFKGKPLMMSKYMDETCKV